MVNLLRIARWQLAICIAILGLSDFGLDFPYSGNRNSEEHSVISFVIALDVPGDPDSLPGWLGASYSVPNIRGSTGRQKSLAAASQRIIQLSASNPRAYLFKNFLSDAECNHIIAKAEPRLERSTVIGSTTSRSEVSEIRTSSGMFIEKGDNPIISRIEKRISLWTLLPVENQEAMQVLRYTRGQKYVPHHDFFPDPPEKQQGGQRYATVLMYLSNVTKGGETVFPKVPDPTPKDDSWSDCAKGNLAVKPRKGDALLFFSMLPDGSPDEYSMHYACPVVEGVKWSAPKWIHVRNYDIPVGMGDPSICADANGMCTTWAALGECEKNPKYMAGKYGACRKACKVCEAAGSNR